VNKLGKACNLTNCLNFCLTQNIPNLFLQFPDGFGLVF
jgi:hypothetical protein